MWMRIRPGEPARYFEVRDVFDQSITLGDFKGEKLLLSFFRYASCPLCNLRLRHLVESHKSFRERGIRMLAFFQSPRESVAKCAGRQEAPFQLIPDPDRSVYQLYGVETSWKGLLRGGLRAVDLLKASRRGFLPGQIEGRVAMVPADFLIGPDQIVHKAYYGKDIGDHLPMAEIKAWLD
jgi:peroxiredoxin